MSDGIQFEDFYIQFGERLDQRYAEEIGQLQQAGLITCTPDRLTLTKQGMLLSNQVFVRFI